MFFVCLKKLDKEISKRDKFVYVTPYPRLSSVAILRYQLTASLKSAFVHVWRSVDGRCKVGVIILEFVTWLIFERDCPCS